MGIDRMRVVNLACEQVGYLEKASNKDLDDFEGNPGSGNYTKYARDIDAIPGLLNGKKQGYPWCAVTVLWCFVKAYGVAEARRLLCLPERALAASCTYAMKYFQAAGRFSRQAQIGAQIFFSWGHTGIVVDVDGKSVYTVEGNSRSGGKEGVWVHHYALDHSTILGYGIPDFGDGESGSPEAPQGGGEQNDEPQETAGEKSNITTLPVISTGAKGATVRALQILLQGNGCSCGKWGTDGDFGPDTERAVREYQSKHGLDVDGVCGEKTWAAILGLNA